MFKPSSNSDWNKKGTLLELCADLLEPIDDHGEPLAFIMCQSCV